MYKKYGNKFMCFSPPVMLATFLFEFGALFYILWRYNMNTPAKLITIVLAALGIFQLSEYMVCGGLGMHGGEWARLGYISITALPALGVHLVYSIAKKKAGWLVYGAYASMAAFMVYFLLLPGGISTLECRPNYAVFNFDMTSSVIYGLYYFLWLIIGTSLAWSWSNKQPKEKLALRWMTIGYILFIVPSCAVALVNPVTIAGFPSIMCGFAVLLAITLTFMVVPRTSKIKRHFKR